jgi:hypothetical protein
MKGGGYRVSKNKKEGRIEIQPVLIQYPMKNLNENSMFLPVNI